MKKTIATFIFFVFLFTIPILSIAQQRDPGDPGGEPTGGDDPVGGGAPIGSGLFILLGLGAAYGGRKTYKYYQKKITY